MRFKIVNNKVFFSLINKPAISIDPAFQICQNFFWVLPHLICEMLYCGMTRPQVGQPLDRKEKEGADYARANILTFNY
jgi:hypothetical protein